MSLEVGDRVRMAAGLVDKWIGKVVEVMSQLPYHALVKFPGENPTWWPQAVLVVLRRDG